MSTNQNHYKIDFPLPHGQKPCRFQSIYPHLRRHHRKKQRFGLVSTLGVAAKFLPARFHYEKTSDGDQVNISAVVWLRLSSGPLNFTNSKSRSKLSSATAITFKSSIGIASTSGLLCNNVSTKAAAKRFPTYITPNSILGSLNRPDL